MPETVDREARERSRPAKIPIGTVVLLALLAAPATIPAAAQDQGTINNLKVLFVGNSQTSKNNLPWIVERMSVASGAKQPIKAERITRGGETFYRHTERRDSGAPLKVIARGGWDYVLLQEHGRLAAESGAPGSLPFASRLVRAAREAGATPLFYMTWAYRDQPEAQARISQTYFKLGSRLNVQVAPVGVAFDLARMTSPDIQLIATDGIHGTLEGTYLAACVIFAKLYNRTPVGIPLVLPENGERIADIKAEQAERLQKIAWQALKSYKQPHGN